MLLQQYSMAYQMEDSNISKIYPIDSSAKRIQRATHMTTLQPTEAFTVWNPFIFSILTLFTNKFRLLHLKICES